MANWIVTGISGSERIELLEELNTFPEKSGKKVCVHDVGKLIRQEAIKNRIPISDERILDMDQSQLRLLRSSALKEVKLSIYKERSEVLHLIGVHATFRWKGRLIPGISFQDLIDIKPDGIINVVNNVQAVIKKNSANPKWDKDSLPNAQETQEWMMVEEFASEALADVLNVPMYLVARTHKISNLAGLFFTKKKKIYLSYPITAVEKDEPELLAKIQGPILEKLEEIFTVFDPLTIKDMSLTRLDNIPEMVEQFTPKAKEIIKSRTIERDFQFIDQSDAVVVFYLTEKVSPGVLAEIYYAHRNQKPVFMVFQGSKSPFIEDATTIIETNIDKLMEKLQNFSDDIH